MADFLSSASTVLNRAVFGNIRCITAEYSLTTGGATNDTVAIPGVTRVFAGWANVASTLSSLHTTAVGFAFVALPTSASTNLAQITISYDANTLTTGARMRYTVFGQ